MVNDGPGTYPNSLDYCYAVLSDFFYDSDLKVNEKNLRKVLIEESAYEFISEVLTDSDKEVPTIDKIIKHYFVIFISSHQDNLKFRRTEKLEEVFWRHSIPNKWYTLSDLSLVSVRHIHLHDLTE